MVPRKEVAPIDLFDLYAKITLDTGDYESGLEGASQTTTSFADKLKNGLATAAKVGTAALTAASAGVVALTKASVENYAEYEQLVGGVDTLFKQASDTVQQYAANAFKTAGMSANEYMSTVTNFSASLIQSLGGDTAAAAELSNQAITDMADNANKMGTSLQSLQDAYRGFSRQNYTMLDNLALGYGGTQEEMQRLLDDAEKLSGIHYELGNFGDMIEAIHVVQTEMGITGTTAAEASSTIEGSVASAKSAWQNLVTGIADENADLDVLVNNFVDSVITAGENIIPRVEQILSGIGDAVTRLAPIIGEKVPQIIVQVLPSLVSAGAQLIVGLVQGIISAVPQLVAAVPEIVNSLISSLSEAFPSILDMGVQMLDQLVSGIESGLPDMISRIPVILDEFLNYITENLPAVLDKGVELLNELVNGIIGAIPDLVAALPKVITSITQFIANNLPQIVEAGIGILVNLISGIISAIPQLVAVLPQIIEAIVNGIGDLMGSIVDIGKNIVEGIWQGISSAAGWLADKVSGFFSGIVDGAKDLLGIHSPSRVFADMGKNMALGLGEGWDAEYDRIRRSIEGGMDFGTANVDFASSGLGIASAGMVNGITSAVQSSQAGGNYTFNLVLPDGSKLASYTFQPMVNYAKANGTPILNPT